MNSEKIKAVQYGLGPIGLECIRTMLNHDKVQLVGAIDIDPGKIGKDVAELLGLSTFTDVKVVDEVEKLLAKVNPHIVVHTTGSFLKEVYSQLETVVKNGVNVVSSAEELLFPQLKYRPLAENLDAIAKENKVTILGTGVNPGFIMDTMALVSTAVCKEVKKVRAERWVDAATRRLPLQKKIGASLSEEEFEKRKETGKLGHVGMEESVALIGYGLGWRLDRITQDTQPVLADEDYQTPCLKIRRKEVAGIHNTGRGFIKGEEVITLSLHMYVGCEKPHDYIRLESDPPVEVEFKSGISGDSATVAMLINSVPRVIENTPGLKNMTEITLPRKF